MEFRSFKKARLWSCNLNIIFVIMQVAVLRQDLILDKSLR